MGYRIKTVSELTGVSRATLLAWERRYGVVTPDRQDNGYREYSDDDVACLQSIQRLKEQGYKVSEAITLIEEAREAAQDPSPRPGMARVAALHDSIAEQIDASEAARGGLKIVYQEGDLDGFLDRSVHGPVDVVVARLSLLGPSPRAALRDCMEAADASAAVVLYEFATHKTLSRLAKVGARLIQGPVRLATLRQAALEQVSLLQSAGPLHQLPDTRPPLPEPPMAAPGQAPAPRFTEEQLGRLREMKSDIDCECPNHLASLVVNLVAFERYSRNCEDLTADDAALHRFLARRAGEARSIVEDLLVRVCEQDDIRIADGLKKQPSA